MPDASKPYRVVWAITETPEDRPDRWTRVGIAYENRDGSVTLRLDALPTSGKLQVRDPRPEELERKRQRGRFGEPAELPPAG